MKTLNKFKESFKTNSSLICKCVRKSLTKKRSFSFLCKPFKGDANRKLSAYGAFRLSILSYLFLLSLYFGLDYLSTIFEKDFSTSELYKQLKKHPFVFDITKLFIALIAIVIAVHRSITTERQITLQQSSNSINDFYSLEKHTIKLMKSVFSNNKYMKVNDVHAHKFFTYIFAAPQDGDYSCSPNLISNLNTYNINFVRQMASYRIIALKSTDDANNEFSDGFIFNKRIDPKSALSSLTTISLELGLEKPEIATFGNFKSLTALVSCLKDILSITEHLPISDNDKQSFLTHLIEFKYDLDKKEFEYFELRKKIEKNRLNKK
jgi:hypothetical protein